MQPNKFNNALFSLFHHDVSATLNEETHLSDKLWNNLQKPVSISENEIGEEILAIIKRKTLNIPNQEIGLTLTGGFDSRVILAALLHLGIKPICFTYGDERNRDIQIARNICKKLGLTYYNVANKKPTKEWYLKWVNQTINLDEGNAHLHRAHRTAAIAELTEIHPLKVLFTGHLGGENIRGLSYNDYFASPFFEDFNENKLSEDENLRNQLRRYFIELNESEIIQLLEIVNSLPWMTKDKNRNKLYFVNELVGKIHHNQDIRIYSKFVETVVPVYLQESYLEKLTLSKHHFMRKLDKKVSFLEHPKLYCQLISKFYPALLDIELSNGYAPKDFLKGNLNYIVKRIWQKYIKKIKNYPSFSYNDWFIEFVNEKSKEISDEIWTIYNKELYFQQLNSTELKTNEGFWHKFSNPIFFDLINKNKLLP